MPPTLTELGLTRSPDRRSTSARTHPVQSNGLLGAASCGSVWWHVCSSMSRSSQHGRMSNTVADEPRCLLFSGTPHTRVYLEKHVGFDQDGYTWRSFRSNRHTTNQACSSIHRSTMARPASEASCARASREYLWLFSVWIYSPSVNGKLR